MLKGILRQGTTDTPATQENIAAALAGKDFFWLDLDDVDKHHKAGTDGTALAGGAGGKDDPGGKDGDEDTVSELLSTTFKFHPLAVQASERWWQRPRIDDYGTFDFMVARGADPKRTGDAEVHIFLTDRYVVTVHRGECGPLSHARDRLDLHPVARSEAPLQLVVVYMVIGALVDSYFPVLNNFDERIDTLENAILAKPTQDQVHQLFEMKRSLMMMRRVVAPERDMLASINDGVIDIPGMTDDAGRYFRDLYDHLIRLADLIDNYRDLLSDAMDTHLSTVSNRLNQVMKQLTIIATIFLPLSFLTGFFGQNFAYLVRGIAPAWTFYAFGIGVELVVVIGMLVLFYQRGWIDRKNQAQTV
ncbi:MAG TPA: magnesium transporter CorA family protein [Acidimicrobiales bacterium]|nr:magnesium transporter CorA family protein [Acidimicrobiales bacterium]